MKKIIAIASRILKELFRDKRTIALIFLAPVLVLTLVNYVFTVNMTPHVNIATVKVPTNVTKTLDSNKNISVHEATNADKLLKDHKTDAVIKYDKNANQYDVKYANTDANKTALIKNILPSTIARVGTDSLKDTMETLLSQSPIKVTENKVAKPTFKDSYVYGDSSTSFFTNIMPTLMGFFVFFFVFLISGMALLKERTTGTLSRLLVTSVRRSEIVLGYTISYGALALIQSTIIVLFSVYVLNIQVVGTVTLLVFVNMLLAMVALAFGLLMSTFAKSEFQMMQFIPLIVIPQIFFSGIIPLDNMASWAQWLSLILPLKYASSAMNDIVFYGASWSEISSNILILVVFLIVLLGINILGLKRYRKV